MPDALDLMMEYHWPGNIRELDNVIKRAVLMKKEGDLLLVRSDFSSADEGGDPSGDKYSTALEHAAAEMLAGRRSIQAVEKGLLEKVVELCGGRTMEAVRRTGIPKDRFYRLRGNSKR